MSRKLNLDIFGPEESPAAREPPGPPVKKTHKSQAVENSASVGSSEEESPKFVPVGFYTEHLNLLDEAVLELRRKKHWKASKSAIIRKLIDLHASELASVWLRESP
jgi:hypothetical protein